MSRVLVIALVCFLVSACSRVEFAYRNADWFLEYQADRAVDITAIQLDLWEPLLIDTLRRHREEELPLVVEYLQLAGNIVGQSAKSGGAACLLGAAVLVYERHARLAVNLTVPLLSSLDAAQIEHLEEYMAQRQEDAAKRYLDPDPERRKAMRQERFFDRIEAWTGKLDDNQRTRIQEALEHIPDLAPSWLVYREQQTKRLLDILKAGADENNLHEFLTEWWVQRSGRSAADRQQWSTAKRELVRLLDGLGSTLTAGQRSNIQSRLKILREELAVFLPPLRPPETLSSEIPACASPPV